MKSLLGIIIVAVAAVLLFQYDLLTPEPVRIYKAYREKTMLTRGYSSSISASSKWSLKMDKYTREDTKATFMLTERTSRIPKNFSSHAFATKVTRKLKVVYFFQHEKWKLGREQVLSEKTSTYENRQNAGQM